MPCEIGQNIHKLREKNKQLLEQLESKSVLLENKIKILRQATRVAGKSIDLKKDNSSPLKRRHESWNFRNNSCRVASSFIKPFTIQPLMDADLCDTENLSTKQSSHDTKNIRMKQVFRQANLQPKTTFKKTLEWQAKGKRNKVNKNTYKSSKTQCYCSKILDNHVHQPIKTQRRAENHSRLKHKCPKHTGCFKSSVHSKLNVNEKLKSSNQPANLDEEYISSADLKSMNEARQLLNYSPESMFLRRMKLRLQKSCSEPVNKDCPKVNELCTCENTISTISESNHSEIPDSCRRHVIGGSDSSQELSNIPVQKETVIREDDNFVNQVKSQVSAIEEKPKQSAGALTEIILQKPVTSVGKNCGCNAHCCTQTEHDKFQSNISKKSTSENITILPNKCLCKKEMGGLCCCEIAQTSDRGSRHLYDVELSAALKSSVSAPTVHPLNSCKTTNIKYVCLDESKSKHREDRRVNGVQTTGYDVIAGLLANDREKLTFDPCVKQVEELSNFRQKHWFDCHAHPHGGSNSGTVKHCRQIKSLEDLQLASNPCTRSYQLNQRLFSRAVVETHNEKCCVAAQGDFVSSPLLPTQRRLVTLPSAPEENINKKHANRICSTLHIREPTSSGHLHSQLPTTSGTLHAHVPLLKNSLALRFQKGVSQRRNAQI